MLGNFFLWLAVVFVSGALLMYGAWRRVLYVEDTIDPNAREAAGLHLLSPAPLLYIQMVLRWCKLAWHGVVGDPVEPLIFCGAFPFLALTTYLGWKAFTAKPDEGSDSGVSYS